MTLPSQKAKGTHTVLGFPVRLAAAIVFVPALVVLSLMPLRPPAVVGAEAAATEFSAARALDHVAALATSPRPMGTSAHARARDYVVDALAAQGLATEVQSATVATDIWGQVRVARVHNVLARLEGSGGAGTLLLMAHYDSAPTSPGASDNGAGVAALLETLRALRAGPRLANDVIFLFTDGEENGLLGAQAFREFHPWAIEVDLVLNFEARGSRGPSIMFETGPGTEPLLARFADLARRPVAASFSYDVYRYLPNDTDFSIFKREGGPAGFNFAFIDDVRAYHSRLDTLDRLDPRSLQHHGSYALALTRGFAELDPDRLESEAPKIYFNLPLLGLVVYSTHWAMPLAAILVLLTGAALYLGFSHGRLRFGRLALGILAFPLAIVLVAMATTQFHRLLWNGFAASRGSLANPGHYRLGMVLVALALAGALWRLVDRKLGSLHLATAAALVWLALAIAATWYLPSTSYLLSWPLLSGLVGLLILLRGSADTPPTGRTAALLMLLAIPAIVLWSPLLSLLGSAFGRDAIPLLAMMTTLAAGITGPQLGFLTVDRRGSLLLLVPLALGLGLTAKETLGARYDAARPRANSIFYALDPEAGKAIWGSLDRRVDDWTSQFLSETPDRRPLAGFFADRPETLIADAPVLPLPPPIVREPADPSATEDGTEVSGDGRRFEFRVASSRRAASFFLELSSDSTITELAVDGLELDPGAAPREDDDPASHWRGRFYGGAGGGFDLEVGLAGDGPLHVTVVDTVYGLPEIPGFSYRPRPPNRRPSFSRPTDLSMVRGTSTLGAKPRAAETGSSS